ncbi:MAG TPA: hypothetical protein VJN39_10665 [Gemmatimonadales bacterium]|nr:hypothetical protein [Gemmatimonadales bacterium]
MNGPEAVAAFVFFGGGFWVLRPIASAVARRISGDAKRGAPPDQLAALRAELLEEVHQVRQEVGELAERVDFAERLLAKPKSG